MRDFAFYGNVQAFPFISTPTSFPSIISLYQFEIIHKYIGVLLPFSIVVSDNISTFSSIFRIASNNCSASTIALNHFIGYSISNRSFKCPLYVPTIIIYPLDIVKWLIPNMSDHSDKVWVSPLYSINRLFVLLFACFFALVQRQFDGS